MLKVLAISGWRGDDRIDHWSKLSQGHRDLIVETLSPALWQGIDLLVHGACPRGVDKYVSTSARPQPTHELPMPADWETHSNIAGSLRNTHMVTVLSSLVACTYQLEVYCFPGPGSVGTIDFMNKVSRICTPKIVELRA